MQLSKDSDQKAKLWPQWAGLRSSEPGETESTFLQASRKQPILEVRKESCHFPVGREIVGHTELSVPWLLLGCLCC